MHLVVLVLLLYAQIVRICSSTVGLCLDMLLLSWWLCLLPPTEFWLQRPGSLTSYPVTYYSCTLPLFGRPYSPRQRVVLPPFPHAEIIQICSLIFGSCSDMLLLLPLLCLLPLTRRRLSSAVIRTPSFLRQLVFCHLCSTLKSFEYVLRPSFRTREYICYYRACDFEEKAE
jgi:hypothetical protein